MLYRIGLNKNSEEGGERCFEQMRYSKLYKVYYLALTEGELLQRLAFIEAIIINSI